MSEPLEVAWEDLRAVARTAASKSYSPYSHVRAGAAAMTEAGDVVEGANVENSSYGLTLCAECSLVSDLARRGGGRIVAVAAVAGDGRPRAPCGRCRQHLFEFGGAELLVDAGEGVAPSRLGDLLPGAFGPDDLTRTNP
ncbi:MAG: cytidine deaminase [Acidimicrobiales bacterium]